MKDSIAHIFLTRFATLINDSKHPTNRICVGLFLLLGFIIPHFVQAQHIDNRKRLDSFQRARAATGATILKVLANSYNVTGGGAYCIGGSGVVVGLDGSQLDTTYQLQLNGVNIGSPVTGDGNAISFGLQTAAGTYTVFANTSTGPMAMGGNVLVTINPLPTVTADPKQVCFGNNAIVLTGTPAGGSWSGTGVSGSTFNANGLAAGNYTVTYSYTDANSCNNSTTATVSVNALPTVTADNKQICIGNNAVALTGTPAGGSWSGTGVSGSTFNANGLAAGNYTVTYSYTDANSCTNTANATVTVNALPSVTANNKQVCFGNNSVVFTGTPAGGTWSGTGVSGSTFNANGLAAGNYTVTYSYTDGNGCVNTAAAIVTVNALPTPAAGSNTPQCAGGTLNLTSTNGTTYSWTGPNSFTSDQQNPSIVNVTTAASGVYTVVVTDGNGCSATTTTNVTINALPIPSAGSNTPQCAGSTLNFTASGGTNYSWSGPNGFTSNSPNPSIANITTAASGVYTVVVTDGNGCSATTTTNVTINALPTPTANSNTPQCAGSTLNLTASSGANYSWTGPNGFTSNSPNPSITNVTTAASGTYTVVVTNASGCSATTTTNVTINALPTPTANSNTPQCAGSTLNFTASGGANYSWTGPNGFTSNLPNPSIANVTTAASGVYTVVVTDENGCSATTTTNVTINALPTPTAGSNTPQCAGSTLNLTANGGTGYNWSGPNGFTSTTPNPSITNVTTAASGVYTVVVTDGNGCSATTTTNVAITPLPTATISYSATPYCISISSAQAVTLSGTNAYTGGTYTATPGGLSINSSTGAITPSTSTAGTYTVTYTTPASSGCAAVTATTSVTITAVPTATISYTGSPFCTTVSSATVTLTGTGAYTGGTYTAAPAGLNINSATGDINPSASTPGTYTVTYAIPASGGCAGVNVTTPVTITALPTVNLTYAGTPFCRSVATGQAATLSGTGAYTGGTFTSSPGGLSINGSTGAITPSTSTAGSYTVTYTTPASGGCATVSTTANIIITAVPTATISYTGTPFCTTLGSAPVTLAGTGAYTGGTYTAAPAGLTINGSTGEITPSSSTAGTYTITYAIPASGGCAAVNVTTSVTITAQPTASLFYAGTPFCRSVATAQNPTLTGTNAYTGGTYTAPAGLTINSGTGAITPSTSTAGTYTVTYTKVAAGGCAAVVATTSVTITAVPTATISYTGTPFCTTLGSAPVTLTGTGAYTGGTFSSTAGLTINSSTGEITPSSSTAGTYTITYAIPASGGCAAVNVTTSVTITAQPTASLSYVGTPFCKTASTQNPVLTGTGAYTGGTYSAAPAGLTINSGTGVITPSSSTAGTYTITYYKSCGGWMCGSECNCKCYNNSSAHSNHFIYRNTVLYNSRFCNSYVNRNRRLYGGNIYCCASGINHKWFNWRDHTIIKHGRYIHYNLCHSCIRWLRGCKCYYICNDHGAANGQPCLCGSSFL
ncbi:beta strand repeat-containing protein [Niastella sp. OAS944]|uniref:beta strand repeat-containing protein n=1 Tax=Niastella sp. OAS944 TaxID=2664089 RepID=UPI003478B86B